MVVKEDLSKRIAKLGLSRVTSKGYGLCKTLYIPVNEEFIEILEKFDDLAWKEHKRWGELMRDAIEEYVERHHPGNPQLSLTKFTENGEQEQKKGAGSEKRVCSFSTKIFCENEHLREMAGLQCWKACPQVSNRML